MCCPWWSLGWSPRVVGWGVPPGEWYRCRSWPRPWYRCTSWVVRCSPSVRVWRYGFSGTGSSWVLTSCDVPCGPCRRNSGGRRDCGTGATEDSPTGVSSVPPVSNSVLHFCHKKGSRSPSPGFNGTRSEGFCLTPLPISFSMAINLKTRRERGPSCRSPSVKPSTRVTSRNTQTPRSLGTCPFVPEASDTPGWCDQVVTVVHPGSTWGGRVNPKSGRFEVLRVPPVNLGRGSGSLIPLLYVRTLTTPSTSLV